MSAHYDVLIVGGGFGGTAAGRQLERRLARYSERQLRQRAIEVHLSTRMVSCEERLVVLSGDRTAPFRSGTIVGTAGQRPCPLGALGQPTPLEPPPG